MAGARSLGKSGWRRGQREAKASVEVGGEDNVLAFLGIGVNFSFRRYPCLHPFWDSPASAKPVDIALGDVRSCPGASRCFLRTFLSLLSFLSFLGVLFTFVLSVCGLLAEVERGNIFRGHWFGAKRS